MSKIAGYTIIAPLCYQGKEGCESVTCTHTGVRQREDGTWDLGRCIGYHCSYCDQPCGSQGHNCDVAKTLIAAATREAHNQDTSQFA